MCGSRQGSRWVACPRRFQAIDNDGQYLPICLPRLHRNQSAEQSRRTDIAFKQRLRSTRLSLELELQLGAFQRIPIVITPLIGDQLAIELKGAF